MLHRCLISMRRRPPGIFGRGDPPPTLQFRPHWNGLRLSKQWWQWLCRVEKCGRRGYSLGSSPTWVQMLGIHFFCFSTRTFLSLQFAIAPRTVAFPKWNAYPWLWSPEFPSDWCWKLYAFFAYNLNGSSFFVCIRRTFCESCSLLYISQFFCEWRQKRDSA